MSARTLILTKEPNMLTEKEMKRERDAEHQAKSLYGDLGEFLEWVKEELPHTVGAEDLHRQITRKDWNGAGWILEDMWDKYCNAKGFELAGE